MGTAYAASVLLRGYCTLMIDSTQRAVARDGEGNRSKCRSDFVSRDRRLHCRNIPDHAPRHWNAFNAPVKQRDAILSRTGTMKRAGKVAKGFRTHLGDVLPHPASIALVLHDSLQSMV